VYDPTCNFFLEYDPRFSVAPFQLCAGKRVRGNPAVKLAPKKGWPHVTSSTFTFLTKRYNVVLSFRTTRVRLPLARNPSPLQYPTLCVQFGYSVRSLLRQPRSALEAGPSEARAISFVLTPRPHLHRTGCAVFSASGFPARTKGIMGNVTFIGLKRHPFSGPVDSVGELLHTP